MARPVKIGLLQTTAVLGDVEHNIKNAVKMIADAAKDGANIVCLPELFATAYNLETLGHKTEQLIEEKFGYIKAEISKAAKDNKVYVISPSGEPTGMPGVVYNSAMVFDDGGNHMGSYAKSHLWALERFHFRDGNSYPVFDTKYGRIGIVICYDMGFPEAMRQLTLQGAELVFVPSAWCLPDMDMRDLNIPQRALENILFVAGVNLYTKDPNLHLFGKSKICNPRGKILKELGIDKEEYAVVEIDMDDVKHHRSIIPYLKDRKPSIYERITDLEI